jgi:hypothetical protein
LKERRSGWKRRSLIEDLRDKLLSRKQRRICRSKSWWHGMWHWLAEVTCDMTKGPWFGYGMWNQVRQNALSQPRQQTHPHFTSADRW